MPKLPAACRMYGLACLVAAMALFLPARAHADKWKEVDSAHFRVLTNGRVRDAQGVAADFERMRYVFAIMFPGMRLDPAAPLVIFAARDGETLRELEPWVWKGTHGTIAGNFDHYWEQQYVVVRLDPTGLEVPAIVYHEYTHSIMHLNLRWLPMWLDEGLAEYYGYTQFHDGKIYIGAPTVRVGALRGARIPIQTLIGINKGSKFFKNDSDVQQFYAESWALVHYLIFGPGMGNGAKLDQFYRLLEQNVDQQTAFTQVFGSFGPIDLKLHEMMNSFGFKAGMLADPVKVDRKTFRAVPLTKAQSDAEIAMFQIYGRHPANARPLVQRALEEDPNLALAHEANAFLEFTNGSDALAQKEFAQAFHLDGTSYLSLFYSTMLSPAAADSTPESEALFGKELGKVMDLNYQFAPAYVQSALLVAREGNPKTALTLSLRAEELEPSRAGYHILNGQLFRMTGQYAKAATYARFVADHWSGPDHDEAVELWNQIPASDRPAGPALAFEIPAGSQTAAGLVKSVQCGDKTNPAVLTLDSSGHSLTFRTKGPFVFGFTDTLWYGEDHSSACRHLEGMPAVIRYHPAADGSYTGDAVEVEIRDALSPISAGDANRKGATEKD